jgi:1-acyl-sn-glycerol-3-phosphate acyltransferase
VQAGVPIVPVAVRGTDVLRPFSRIDVTIGPPIKPDVPAWWELSRRVTQVVENVRVALARGLRGRRS